MRFPKPLYRKQKGIWVVQLRDGRQKSLGKDKDAAFRRYKKIMLHEDGSASPAKSLKVAEVFDLYLEYCEKETASYDLYKYFLNLAAKSFGKLRVRELKPYHLRRWLQKHEGWGLTTRQMVVSVVKAAFNFGVKEGHIREVPPAPPLG